MTPSQEKGTGKAADEVDLDLPALDGEEEHVADSDPSHDLPETSEDDGADPFDDAAFGGLAGDEEVATAASEGGWLEDVDANAALDIGVIDVSLQPEGKVLEDDEADMRGGLEDLISADEAYVVDGGEEGPLADDEELREEDLPQLDADEDGEVPDDALFDRAVIGGDDELRWADRAWALFEDGAKQSEESDESGMLMVPGDDPRDAAWKALDETGRVLAAAFVPGDAVVLAFASPDRARAFLVRVQPDGEQRIIAEVDPRTEDDGNSCVVTSMRWDAARNCLVVCGSFGVHSYRPS